MFVGGGDGNLRAYDVSTGSLLWSARRAPMLGGVSISTDRVLVGSIDHAVYTFALPRPATPSLAVLSPDAGEQWLNGERYNITWNASLVSKVDVSLSRDSGATWVLLAGGVDASVGSIQVKAKKPKSETAVVRVADSSTPSVFSQSGMFYIR